MAAIKNLSDIFSTITAKLIPELPLTPIKENIINVPTALAYKTLAENNSSNIIDNDNHTNIIEEDDGQTPQIHHMSHPSHNIILPDTPTPQRVRRAQPPRVNPDGPSQNLRSKYTGCVSAKYNLIAHAIQTPS